jgi:hypothetical protein
MGIRHYGNGIYQVFRRFYLFVFIKSKLWKTTRRELIKDESHNPNKRICTYHFLSLFFIQKDKIMLEEVSGVAETFD